MGLIDSYSSTVYATLGALNAASAQSHLGDYEAAQYMLNWVISKSSQPEYADIARVRLAAVQLSAKKPEEALKTLDAVKPLPALQVELDDRYGDVYYALGQYDKAREHWTKVLESKSQMDNNLRTLVNIKMGSLPLGK